MASAFPTLSPTASTIRKSFFDGSGGIGSTISGNALIAVYPLTERKGKAKSLFITVHQTLFEVHKSAKDAKNKKAAKYLVDFGDVFNVSVQNEPVQIKEECICIMDPSTTFFIKTVQSEYDLQAWFDWILERSRECRSTKLLRPVFREEYFEAAWDVQIIRRPKLGRDFSKKQPAEAQIEDLCEKRPEMLGHRRLCICPSSFLIFTIGCRPSSSIDAPFDKSTFVDLSLNVISNYGTQERYFFIRIGRCSEIGSGELWMATEHGASAKAMHERISQINQRESERRRAQGIKVNLPTISSSVLKSRAHRERSQTQNMNKMKHRLKGEEGKAQQQQETSTAAATESRKVSTNSNNNNEESRQQKHGSNGSLSQRMLDVVHQPGRVDSIGCLQSIPERLLLSDQAASSSKKNSLVNMLASRIGAKMSAGSAGKPVGAVDGKMDQLTAPSSPSAQSYGVTFGLIGKNGEESQNTSLVNLAVSSSNQSARNSLVNSVFGLRLTRRDSLTSSKGPNTAAAAQQQRQSSVCAQPSYDCAEDYMTYDADERSNQCGAGAHSLKLGSIGSRVSGCGLTRTGSRKSNSSYSRQFSTGSGPGQMANSSEQYGHPTPRNPVDLPGDYLDMNMDLVGGQQQSATAAMVPRPYGAEPVFALHEVQSYVSNSSESCWTPGSSNTNRSSEPTNAPRAYSLGSRPGQEARDESRPASSEMMGRMPVLHSQQLLHPAASGSPPNYLKRTILGQTAKNIKKEAAATAENLENQKQQQNQEGFEEAGEEEGDEAEQLTAAEVRKRAHSVGSKTWIKPSLRKLSTAMVQQQQQKRRQQHEEDCGGAEEDNSRRNTYGAKSIGGSSSTFYPHSMEDHVEIDFDRDESPSVDSIPSMNSRNSSLGKQCPMGIRSALDSLAYSRGFGSPGEKPSDKLIQSKGRDIGGDVQQIKRKRSVPEMFQQTRQSTGQQQHLPNNASFSPAEQSQQLLHPNRRSTYDSAALRLKLGERRAAQQQKRCSPPRAAQAVAASTAIPSSQSTSSGISSRSSATDSSSLMAHGGAKERKGEAIAEDEDDDYVLLSTPKGQQPQQRDQQQQQQQLSVRSIGTILESSSPCSSSLSSDGEGKRRGRLKTRQKASPSSVSIGDEFLDDYAPLFIKEKSPVEGGSSPARTATTTAAGSPPRLAVPSKGSRSPSQSPKPQRKFSAQHSPSPVRSYFPVHSAPAKREEDSPARRKTSTASTHERMFAIGGEVQRSLRKFTCPNLATPPIGTGKEAAGKRGRKAKPSKECDYAFISGQDQ